MAKPPTVVGRANQKASGRKIIKAVMVASDTKKSIQYPVLDFFSDIKSLIFLAANLIFFLI